MMDFWALVDDNYVYWLTALLMAIGLYILLAYGNLIKKLIGLGVFQSAVFILFILFAKAEGGAAPILTDAAGVYSNPLPHVMILTAIVVAISTTALGLSLIVRIHDSWNTLDEEDFE